MEKKQYPAIDEEPPMANEPVVARRHRLGGRGLTPTQVHLLRAFSYNNSEEYAREIQEVLTKHFQAKLDEESDRLWDEGILDQKKLDELRQTDLHAK